MDVDAATWDKHNLWPLNSGELAVRPGFRTLYSASGASLNIVWGQTVRNPRTRAVVHYTLCTPNNTTGATLRIFDENWSQLQAVTLNCTETPTACSLAVVENEVMVCSPSFPSYHGIVGGPLSLAVKVAAGDSSVTALDIPRGIAASFAGRCVIANDEALFISLPTQPRTFAAFNQSNPPGGTLYGLHVTASGQLVIVTSDGVYSLPVEAAQGGDIVLPVWSKMTDYSAPGFNSSASCLGRLYGLTRKGYRMIDQASAEGEVLLDDNVNAHSRTTGGRASFVDYRRGRLVAGPAGPIVAIGGISSMTDLATGLRSWQYAPNASNTEILSMLEDQDGAPLFAFSDRVCRYVGNYDDAATANVVAGSLTGGVRTPPEASPVLRRITFEADGGQAMDCLVDDTQKSLSPPQPYPVIGTDSWGQGSYQEWGMRSRMYRQSHRTDNTSCEVIVRDYPTRIQPTVCFEWFGPGKRRPTS